MIYAFKALVFVDGRETLNDLVVRVRSVLCHLFKAGGNGQMPLILITLTQTDLHRAVDPNTYVHVVGIEEG